MKHVYYFDVIEPIVRIGDGPHKEHITRYWFEDIDMANAQRMILQSLQRNKTQRILPWLHGARIGIVSCPPQDEIGTRVVE